LKVVLLAGGLGTRARPFTNYFPKSMIPINGKPMIDYIVRYLACFSEGSDFIIVCEFDHLGKQIVNYFEGKEELIGKKIIFVEDKKMGTGGALLNVEELVKQNDCFLVWFADNLCALNVDDLICRYKALKYVEAAKNDDDEIKSFVGLIVTREHRFEETGRVILDTVNNQEIKEFMEKPKVKLQSPEALGIYLFRKYIFGFLHERRSRHDKNNGIFNLSYDVLPEVLRKGGKLFSHPLGSKTRWIDIESPIYADRNKDIIDKIISQMSIRDTNANTSYYNSTRKGIVILNQCLAIQRRPTHKKLISTPTVLVLALDFTEILAAYLLVFHAVVRLVFFVFVPVLGSMPCLRSAEAT
jgi:mannose-1-phosphate guanylyltransferase